MRYQARSRPLVLIVIAVLLPAGVLIGLARRVIRQGAELAAARAVQEHRDAIAQLGRELAAHLEAIKLQEINRWIRVPTVPNVEEPPDSALVFVAALDGNRMVLPWESGRMPVEPTPDFARFQREGESLEFQKRDFSRALESYRQARAVALQDAEKCAAMLAEARILAKRGRAQQAVQHYRRMLKDCGTAVDEDGIPFSLYAAERLINLKDAEFAEKYILERAGRMRWMPPYETYMIRSLLKSAVDDRGIAARKTIDGRLAEIDRIQAFAREFPRLRLLAETAWVAYGTEPWLVTVAPPGPPLPSLVFVVSSAAASQKFLPASASPVAKDTPGSEPLGEGFQSVYVKLPPGQSDDRARRVSSSFYITGITLMLGITILAAFLLLRDVNRELRMAEMRSHFVASVSHELKTPLTAIRMFAETLALGRARDDKTRSQYLETIVNESERLTRLVDNVLDFSKIEQGKKIYRMQPTSLADVVRSAAQAMQYPLARQGFTLKVSIDDAMPLLPADPDALQQAILNLLSNAMKYSGSARDIDLLLKSAGQDAIIEVVDRGVGIDPQEREHIFEKFYRGRSAETESIAGTGLGLTVVQHIVQAHGGRMELNSVKGAGSTFSIRIPFLTEEKPA